MTAPLKWVSPTGFVMAIRDTTSALAETSPSVSIDSAYSGQLLHVSLDEFAELVTAAKSGALDHLISDQHLITTPRAPTPLERAEPHASP